MGTFVKHLMLMSHASPCATRQSGGGGGDHSLLIQLPASTNRPGSPSSHHIPIPIPDQRATRRWAVTSTLLAAATSSFALAGAAAPAGAGEAWGTRSFVKERYFQPDLSPEDSVARIKQTADGIREMRHMLDAMAWRYVLHYVRLKAAYMNKDLRIAMAVLPENRRKEYVMAANELVENISQLDRYIRTPKVYESYVYYEKTIKSLDGIVAMFA